MTPFNALRVILDHSIGDLERCVKDLEIQAAVDPDYFKSEVNEKTRDTMTRLSNLSVRLSRIVVK